MRNRKKEDKDKQNSKSKQQLIADIFAPDIEYDIDETRFEFDEIMYNARILRKT